MPGLPKKYILFVGSRQLRYKGFQEFVKAAKIVMRRDPSMHTVCAGGPPFNPNETAQIGEFRERVHHIPNNPALTPSVFHYAQALVSPSICEGFGMSLLESMTCGCPLVCTDIPVFREVAGPAAVYFKPSDPAEMSDAIFEAISSEREIRRAGIERSKMFSWKKTAEQTKQVYEHVLERI
jgi:glycosyltransferase involved in cell wall biosynthesis